MLRPFADYGMEETATNPDGEGPLSESEAAEASGKNGGLRLAACTRPKSLDRPTPLAGSKLRS